MIGVKKGIFNSMQKGSLLPLTTAFAGATGIADNTILNALNNMEKELKGQGTINNQYDFISLGYVGQILPMVGGTEALCRYEFLTATQVPAPINGWTFSSQGALSDGSTGYWNMGWNPSTIYGSYEKYGFLIYNNFDLTGYSASVQNYVCGSFSGNKVTGMSLNYVNLGIDYFAVNDDVTVSHPDPSGLGTKVVWRSTPSNLKVTLNTGSTTDNTSASGPAPNSNFELGRVAGLSFGKARFGLFIRIDDLSNTASFEMELLRNISNAFNTALGR